MCLSFATHDGFFSQRVRFRLHTHAIPPLSSRPVNSRGIHERIQYAEADAKKANRNDEAESAQTEVHRSFAKEGAEPTGPRLFVVIVSAASRVRPAVAGFAFWPLGAGSAQRGPNETVFQHPRSHPETDAGLVYPPVNSGGRLSWPSSSPQSTANFSMPPFLA